MTNQLLFYRDVVPLNRETHKDAKINLKPERFGNYRDSHLVPALVDEFLAASPHLPIVFMPTAEGPAACFLVGLRSGVNACVDSDGKWRGDYVPAYLRRHPFILGEVDGSDPLVCVDQQFVSDNGEALFDGEGKESPVLLDFIRLTNEYFASSKRTENFAKTLARLNLLRSVNIDAKFETGETLALYGCLTIDEEKFAGLSDEDFLQLRKDGFLPAIYGHMASLANIERVRRIS
jgi:hypothetical protein